MRPRSRTTPGTRQALEIAWLDEYHAAVRAKVAPLLEPDVAAWLDAATQPLAA